MAPQLLFFTGKGGVGKSTLSALYSLAHAKRGRDVLLVSLDPAHNLGDIFQVDAGNDEEVECANGLLVREPDIRSWSERYLRDIEDQMRASYSYLTSLNIDRYFSVLRHSPGLDEHAMSLIFRTILEEHAFRDIIVLDMPPTALTLRFFAAPSISAVWADELLALRRSILERKQMITTVKLGSRTIETDKVMERLEIEQARYASMKALFADAGTSVHIVVNPDELSRREGRRIFTEMLELGIPPAKVLINKAESAAEDNFSMGNLQHPAVVFPRAGFELQGIRALERYLEAVGTAFTD